MIYLLQGLLQPVVSVGKLKKRTSRHDRALEWWFMATFVWLDSIEAANW